MSPGMLKGAVLGCMALGLVGLIGLGTSSGADTVAVDEFGQPVPASDVVVELENEAGQPLRTFSHKGESWMLGEVGSSYRIRVSNRSDRRIEAVVSVDGRDVVSGEVAGVKRRGYIVQPHDSVVIEGFRRSMDTVAAFRFSNPGKSYSALKGSPQNVGVIGVAVFEERESRPSEIAARSQGDGVDSKFRRPGRSGSASDEAAPAQELPAAKAPSGARPASPADSEARRSKRGRRWTGGSDKGEGKKFGQQDAPSNLGTGWGEDRHSQVSSARFVRASAAPSRVVRLRYDDRSGLRRRGIRLDPERTVQFAQPPGGPQAFPGR